MTGVTEHCDRGYKPGRLYRSEPPVNVQTPLPVKSQYEDVWILLLGQAREHGLRKLQISNATLGCHERSILLAFCNAKRDEFSNPVILRVFSRIS
jgi:hypothetical protein